MLAAVQAFLLYPETARKSLEEVEEMFRAVRFPHISFLHLFTWIASGDSHDVWGLVANEGVSF